MAREIYAETEWPLSILAVLASPPAVYLVLCCAEVDIVSGSVQCMTTCFCASLHGCRCSLPVQPQHWHWQQSSRLQSVRAVIAH